MFGKPKYLIAKLADRVDMIVYIDSGYKNQVKEPAHEKLIRNSRLLYLSKNICIANKSPLLMNNDFNKRVI